MGLLDKLKKKKVEEVSPVVGKQETKPVEKVHEDSNELLVALIARHHEERSGESLIAVLDILKTARVWVPMTVTLSEEDVKTLMNAKKSDVITTKGNMKMRPDILKTSEGELFYPAFSTKEEAPQDYRKRFSWVCLSFVQYAVTVLNNPKINAIVINAFSKNLILSKDILRALTNTNTEARPIEKGTVIELTALGSTQEELVLQYKAMECMKAHESVKKAYVAKMKKQDELSYVFVIDAPGANPQKLFSEMNQQLQGLKMNLPMDFAMYPVLKKQLEMAQCEAFYVKE